METQCICIIYFNPKASTSFPIFFYIKVIGDKLDKFSPMPHPYEIKPTSIGFYSFASQ